MADLTIRFFKTRPFGKVSGVKREVFEAMGKVFLLGLLAFITDNLESLC
nr:hypothetical protein [uncultured Ruegeria sp.]